MRRALALAIAGMAVVAATPLAAQTYPSRAIKVIVPVPAGALTDVISRRIAIEASRRMGQPWIMENRPGANFLPAAQACRDATGDGYTLCIFTTSTLTFNPHLIDNLPYNPETDFVPIVNLGGFIGGLVASPKVAVKTIDELKALALAKPGELNLGTYGPASSANVFRQYMNEKWKSNVVEVGYKGSNELLAALLSGEIHMTWTALGSWADNPNDAKGKVLVADSLKRSPRLPNVPLYADVGFGDFPIHTWFGLFAPKGTPADVVARVHAAVAETINQPAMTEYLVNQIIEPAVTSSADFARYIAREREATGVIFKRLNIPKIK
jgi:tripartite-type tricarboxylate transporter receptor subunit TctC